ncbi:N-glycosylase/DNA lyase [Pancytospora philotis]|nr:N-glycosylase/DNA lyase [Pancytospora philotis]
MPHRWVKLEHKEDICLDETLFSGQVFHFRRLGSMRYAGVLDGVAVVLQQRGEDILYLDSHPSVKALLVGFFNLDVRVDLPVSKPGLRFLTNDFYPTVFSFICSSNNNIKRISSMVAHLYSKGRAAAFASSDTELPLDGAEDNELMHSIEDSRCFPDLEALVGIEAELVREKFGYRARYICAAAEHLLNSPCDWHTLGYEEARARLLKIPGVGRKVADCICLIALRQFHVVPIDTHIFKYSVQAFGLQFKALNASAYGSIQEQWVKRFGEHAGIAQLYAFKSQVDLRLKPRGRNALADCTPPATL